MAAVQIEVGDNMYLFCQKGTHAPRLVITSHGGVSGTFDTPRKLYFYAELGDAMIDRTIAAIIRGATPHNEIVAAGTEDTEDYQLDKYQSKEGEGPETYKSLLDEVKRLAQGSEEDLWDIVTIRNRKGSKQKTMKLSDVLEELAAQQPERFAAYREVHCSFCRV